MTAKLINQLPVYNDPLANPDVFHINVAGVDYQIPASLLSSSVSSLLGFTTFGESIVQSADAPSARSILEAEQRANLLTAITTLQDTDELIISDANDSGLSKKITVANLKLGLAASQAEVVDAGVDDKYVAPSTLLGLFNASSQSTDGVTRFPINVGGTFDESIIQTGFSEASPAGSPVLFPVAFPTAVRSLALCPFGSSSGIDLRVVPGTISTSGFTLQRNSITDSHYWIAIGH